MNLKSFQYEGVCFVTLVIYDFGATSNPGVKPEVKRSEAISNIVISYSV